MHIHTSTQRHKPLTIIIGALVAILLSVTLTPALATPPNTVAQINVNIGGATHPLNMGLSTGLQSWNEVAAGLPTIPALQAWNPPLVRLHLGFMPADDTLPEATQGSWDFTHMDTLISTLRNANIGFFVDIKSAPQFMFDQTTGQLDDAEFGAFATYMTRLVQWYNKGGFTDDAGVFHASGHINWIHTWEIWNEPKSAWDIPAPVACRSCAPWMTAPRSAHLYDVVSTAMRAADPTIQVGAPAINSWPDLPYLQTFMADETTKLDFFSLHFYGATSAEEPDQQVFASIYGTRFAQRLTSLRTFVPASIPLWVDELNIDESSSPTDIDPRGTSPVIYPFLGASFIVAAKHGVALVNQFVLRSDIQFGLIDIVTGAYYRPYWLCVLLSQQFPANSSMLTVGVPPGIDNMAVIAPDGKSVRILLANVTANSATDVNGPGLVQMADITLSGTVGGRHIDLSTPATLWTFDATAPVGAMPTPTAVTLQSISGGGALALTIPGDSAIVLSVPLA